MFIHTPMCHLLWPLQKLLLTHVGENLWKVSNPHYPMRFPRSTLLKHKVYTYTESPLPLLAVPLNSFSYHDDPAVLILLRTAVPPPLKTEPEVPF